LTSAYWLKLTRLVSKCLSAVAGDTDWHCLSVTVASA
jgi:hypothetical protein